MKDMFDELRNLLKSRNEKVKNLDNLSLLEVVEAHGMNFVRLRWWLVGDNFDP